MELKTTIEALDGKQDLLISRMFDLPLDLLFRAYTEPEFIEQWMGTKVIKLENKNHGSFMFETSHNGMVVFKAHGTIHSFLHNERIVRTFEMENTPIGVQLEFLEFTKVSDDKSQLKIQIIFKSEQHRAEQLKMPFAYGLNMAHNRLQELLKEF